MQNPSSHTSTFQLQGHPSAYRPWQPAHVVINLSLVKEWDCVWRAGLKDCSLPLQASLLIVQPKQGYRLRLQMSLQLPCLQLGGRVK